MATFKAENSARAALVMKQLFGTKVGPPDRAWMGPVRLIDHRI